MEACSGVGPGVLGVLDMNQETIHSNARESSGTGLRYTDLAGEGNLSCTKTHLYWTVEHGVRLLSCFWIEVV